ncbi:Uncharacterised protein [Mycobacteroides abscessus subsp. abscessus]|nr:Uncharacterised protein [Mycobacteroides abscessus subsp. abscessus]
MARQERFSEADAQQLRVLVGDRFGFIFTEPAIHQIPTDTGELVARGLIRCCGLSRCTSQRRRTDRALVRYLIRPALSVVPAEFVSSVGVGLPAAGIRSRHGSKLALFDQDRGQRQRRIFDRDDPGARLVTIADITERGTSPAQAGM